MDTKATKSLLKAMGWFTFINKSKRFAYLKLPDRTVQMIYRFETTINEQDFYSIQLLTTDAFSSACRQIDSEDHGHYQEPLTSNWRALRLRAPEILDQHIAQASHQAIAWAEEQDLAKALRDNVALPTDCSGTLPIRHLAALALLGNVAQLTAYQSSFAAGDRLDFEPHISKEHIDRALVIAQQVHHERT